MPARIYPKRLPRIWLAAWREHVGITQQQLADRIGTTDVTISRWETGKRRPDMGALAAMAEAMGRQIQDMYRHPNQISADELLRDQPADVVEQAIKLIRAIRR